MFERKMTATRVRPSLVAGAFAAVAVLLSACQTPPDPSPPVQVAFDEPGDTSQIVKVGELVTGDGWRYEHFRNLAYECSLPKADGSTGYQSFVIGARVSDPDTAERPLWVRMRGGGAGWFDEMGTAQPDDELMREEPGVSLGDRLRENGLLSRISEHPAGFRGLSVSMCNRDLYGGANNADPNNLRANGSQRSTSGLLATKAAIAFTMDRFVTSDFFLHGGSAGSVGTYHVAWSLQEQGTPPAGIVADGGIRNEQWESDRIDQDICDSPYGGPAMVEAFSPRAHSQLRGSDAQAHELVSSGTLEVPVAQVWNQGDATTCGAIPMDCNLPSGPVAMGASDCKNEPLRAAIEAEGPMSESLSLGVCVTKATSAEPCDVHVSTPFNLPNTNPAYPEDYLATLVEWVDARMV